MASKKSKSRPRAAPLRRGALSRERVLEAGLALADREGLGSLSMRALGAELGVEAMSLYKHVGSKDALLDGIVGLAIADGDWTTDTDEPWELRMESIARSLRDVGCRHPEVFPLVVARPGAGEALLEPLEAMLEVLAVGGFDAATSVSVFWSVLSYVFGAVLGEIEYERTGSFLPQELFEGASGFPRTMAAAELLGSCSFEEEYLAGVRRIVAGAAAEKPRRAVAKKRRKG